MGRTGGHFLPALIIRGQEGTSKDALHPKPTLRNVLDSPVVLLAGLRIPP